MMTKMCKQFFYDFMNNISLDEKKPYFFLSLGNNDILAYLFVRKWCAQNGIRNIFILTRDTVPALRVKIFLRFKESI